MDMVRVDCGTAGELCGHQQLHVELGGFGIGLESYDESQRCRVARGNGVAGVCDAATPKKRNCLAAHG